MQTPLEQITSWLVAPDTVGDPTELFDELATRLSAAGAVLTRMSASLMTKHPDVFGKQLIWARGKGARAVLRSHAIMASAMYHNSPVAYVRRERRKLRARLEDRPAAELEYDLYRELQASGATDYVVLPMPFRAGLTSFLSFATDRPGGFSDEEIALFEAIVPPLSLRWELESATYSLQTLLSAYLGGNAAQRVLAGEFKRRTGSVIDAVIWTSDLRLFTTFMDRHPVDDVLNLLDDYFHCVAAPVAAHGGEVLKFIGDAVLAVFPIADGGEADACQRSLLAARDARGALDEVNARRVERGDERFDFGVGLHRGQVVYGNIGVEGRLDFTVIGQAVNVACRVEALTKQLDAPILLTAAFVEAAADPEVRSVGKHTIRGVSEPMALFALEP